MSRVLHPRRSLQLAGIALLVALSRGALAAPAAGGETVELSSRTLTLHSGRKLALAEGEVVATTRDFVLRCREAEAHYGEDRRVNRLVARGEVHVVRATDGLEARAERGEYDHLTGVLTLFDQPVVTRDGDVLRGEQMVVALREDRLEVTRPRVSLAERPGRAAAEVEAEHLVSREGGDRSTFERQVLIRQGDLTARGDRLFVTTQRAWRRDARPRAAPAAIDEADSARVRLLTLVGNVDAVRGTQQAQSSRAVYDVDTGDLVLEGRPVVRDGGDVLRGERIVIDGATGNARVERAVARVRTR